MSDTCLITLETGARRGVSCGKKNARGETVCSYHLKKKKEPDQTLTKNPDTKPDTDPKPDTKKKQKRKQDPIHDEKESRTNECRAILKKGARAGQECGRKNCASHKEFFETETVPVPLPDAPTCTYVFTKGEHKGTVCGKKTCVHKKNKIAKETKTEPPTKKETDKTLEKTETKEEKVDEKVQEMLTGQEKEENNDTHPDMPPVQK